MIDTSSGVGPAPNTVPPPEEDFVNTWNGGGCSMHWTPPPLDADGNERVSAEESHWIKRFRQIRGEEPIYGWVAGVGYQAIWS